MSKSQIIGIGMVILGVALYFLVENGITDVISGALCAIGLGYILKWIPFKRKKLN